MEKQILLSICIPTYNRAAYLHKMLDSLLPQLKNIPEDIYEVIISDNASTDDTYSVVDICAKEYNVSIKYHRNSKNIGLDNLSYAADMARGKYSFLCGDDDILSPNFIDTIMPYVVSEKEYGIVHWNRLECDANGCQNKVFDPNMVENIIFFSDTKSFVEHTMRGTNFISSRIYNTKCWKEGKNIALNNIHGYERWARMVLGALTLDMPCVYYYFPLVQQRHNNHTWGNFWPYYFFVELSEIFLLISKYVDGVYEKWINEMYRYDVKARIESIIDNKEIEFYRQHIKDFKPHLHENDYNYLELLLYSPNPQRVIRHRAMIERIKKRVARTIKY